MLVVALGLRASLCRKFIFIGTLTCIFLAAGCSNDVKEKIETLENNLSDVKSSLNSLGQKVDDFVKKQTLTNYKSRQGLIKFFRELKKKLAEINVQDIGITASQDPETEAYKELILSKFFTDPISPFSNPVEYKAKKVSGWNGISDDSTIIRKICEDQILSMLICLKKKENDISIFVYDGRGNVELTG